MVIVVVVCLFAYLPTNTTGFGCKIQMLITTDLPGLNLWGPYGFSNEY